MSYQKFFITILVKKENIENNEKTFRDRGYRIMWDILVGILVDFEIKQEKWSCEQRKRK